MDRYVDRLGDAADATGKAKAKASDGEDEDNTAESGS